MFLSNIAKALLLNGGLNMNPKKSALLKIAGISGILAPILAFACIALAITSYPQFSWTENALSDLGVVEGVTATIFNYGLIVSGILAVLFALGLFQFLHETTVGRIGAFIFILATFALISIGVFPENVKPAHYYASVAFFVLALTSMIVVDVAFLLMAKVKMGLFTFLAAVFAAVVWAIQWTVRFGSNVAIPEALSALSASVWTIVLGLQYAKGVFTFKHVRRQTASICENSL